MALEVKSVFFSVLLLSQCLNLDGIPIKIKPSSTSIELRSTESSNVSILKMRALGALADPIKNVYNKFRPALKIVGLFYIGLQMVNFLMPAITASWGSSRNLVADETEQSLSHAIGELGVSAMVEGWRFFDQDNSSEKSPKVLSTWQKQCKNRATCELGRSLSSRMPYISKVVGYFSSRIPFIGQFGEALSSGINSPDCSSLFPECPYLRSTLDEL